MSRTKRHRVEHPDSAATPRQEFGLRHQAAMQLRLEGIVAMSGSGDG